MIAASQYKSWKRWQASRAAIMISLVMSWIGKRRSGGILLHPGGRRAIVTTC